MRLLGFLLSVVVAILILSQPAVPVGGIDSGVSPSQSAPYTEYQLPGSGLAPLGIAVDGRGTVWSIATGTNSLVAFYPTNSSFKSYDIPNNATKCEAWGVAVAADGSVWFGDAVSNAIWRFRVGAQSFSSYPIPTSNAYPFQLAFGPDGSLYFTELFAGKIGRLSPQTGQIAEFRTPSLSSGPAGLDFDRKGRIWVAEQYAGRLSVLDPKTGEFLEYALPGSRSLRGLAVDEGGDVWVADSSSSSIIRFDPATNSTRVFDTLSSDFGFSSPLLMKLGADGSIWFNERTGNRIGRIYPTTMRVVEFQLPYMQNVEEASLPACCRPVGNLPYIPRELLSIAVDKSGDLWFSEYLGNMIGVVFSSYSPTFTLSVGEPGPLSRNSSALLNVTISSSLPSSSLIWVEHILPEASKNLTVTHSWNNPVSLGPNAQVTNTFFLSIPLTVAPGNYGLVFYAEGLPEGTPIVSTLVTLQVMPAGEGLKAQPLFLTTTLAIAAILVVIVLILVKRRRAAWSIHSRLPSKPS